MSPLVVLDTSIQCESQAQDMLVEQEKSLHKQDNLIPEEPTQDSVEEHHRYNTR